MSTAARLNVGYVEAEIQARFGNLIDLSDKAAASETVKKATLNTRGLAAFALSGLVDDLDDETAASHVTDGTRDGGIDALYVNELSGSVYVVQSKWHSSGTGSIEQGDTLKTLAGLRFVMEERFDKFNSKFEHIWPSVEAALARPTTVFELVLVSTGTTELGKEVEDAIEDAKLELNELSELLRVTVLGIADLRRFVIEGTASSSIDITMHLANWGPISEPYTAYFGLAKATDLVDLYETHGGRLFDKNLRKALGTTSVNSSLIQTIRDNPAHFWYFNNGVTAICRTIAKQSKGASNRLTGDFEVTGMSVVNGAQTISSLAAAHSDDPDALEDVLVWTRIISTDGAPADFANEVTRSTNTQNSIEASDFFALDDQQIRLKEDLRLALKLDYVFRRGETPPSGGGGTSALEALVALACAQNDPGAAVIAKSAVGRLEERGGRYYGQLINPSTTAHQLWNSVRVLRAVDETLALERQRSEGKRKAIAQQGNRIVAHIVMQRLGGLSRLGELLDDDSGAELESSAKEQTPAVLDVVAERIQNDFPSNYITSLFKNAERCGQLVSDALEDLAAVSSAQEDAASHSKTVG